MQSESIAPPAANGWNFFSLRAHPLATFLGFAVLAILIYFFGFVPLFSGARLSTFRWAWEAWNPETNYEHAKLIPFITAFLIWYDRDRLRAAPLGSSRWGWLFIGIGLFLYFAAARTLQARLALTALPFLLFGIVLYLWGPKVARVLLFPIAFLLFMVPLNFLEQATSNLQFIETGAATAICNFIGIHVYSLGTTINATNESFHFQIDEGCSGIRSLMAISMLSAIYGHLTQDRLWKKLLIFAAAIVFAIIGNAGRLVSIMVVARLFGQQIAGGPFHAISGYLSFPFAIAAMLLFGKLINLRFGDVKNVTAAKETVSYDY
ncbi:MAG TPA: exosortase/archaeosortase family protein [Chthoniobacterales bacterium]|jgi:exosortase